MELRGSKQSLQTHTSLKALRTIFGFVNSPLDVKHFVCWFLNGVSNNLVSTVIKI